ncbi:MAG: hypothetical protein MJ071_02985 [Oscillospiraceae bacterium]|nr:hypothetical protein [Oscillospiraceae bacterium]
MKPCRLLWKTAHAAGLSGIVSTVLFCTACGKAESIPEPQPIPEISVLTSEPAVTEWQTAPVQMPAETAPMTAPAFPAEIAETLYTEPVLMDALYQGGEGEEQYAETPMPQFFTFRFFPEGVSARLAGGTYQRLSCDLTQLSPADIESHYCLQDCNFDGITDLFVPVHMMGADIQYAVFLWNDRDKAFSQHPFYLSNPRCSTETQNVVCLEQKDDVTAHITAYRCSNEQMAEQWQRTAHYDTLTLTYTHDEAAEDTSFSDRNAMEQAFLSYYYDGKE